VLRRSHLGGRQEDVEADLEELFFRRLRTRGRVVATWRYYVDVSSVWQWPRIRPMARPRPGRASTMIQDVIFACRLFRRQPLSMALAILGLALAIGVTGAVFSIVNAIVFRGSGVSDPGSVVSILATAPPRSTSTTPTIGDWAYVDYLDLSRAMTTMEVVARAHTMGSLHGPDGASEDDRVGVSAVSGNYFAVLGGQTVLGRPLTASDDAAGAAPVAVMSHLFWETHLHADRGVIGRQVWIAGEPFTVVGVAARGFAGPSSSSPLIAAPALWATLQGAGDAARARNAADARAARTNIDALRARPALTATDRTALALLEAKVSTAPTWNPPVQLFGRLRHGVTRAQARANAMAAAAGVAAAYSTSPGLPFIVTIGSVDRRQADRDLGVVVSILLTTVALVMLVACVNVANLLLAAATRRRHEISTRLALGASRARIVRQLMTESLLLALVAGGLGLLLAVWLAPVVAVWLQLPHDAVDVHPDVRVYVFTTILTVAASVVAGLTPAWHGGHFDLISAMKGDRASSQSLTPVGRLRTMLVAGQAAASTLLLVVTALFVRSLVNAATVDVGFDAGRLMIVQAEQGVERRGWDANRIQAFRDVVLSQIQHVPGVAGAALAERVPFSGVINRPLPDGEPVTRQETTAEYFKTVGIRVLRGRTYTPDEVHAGAPVAVISARLAQRFWGSEDPIGSSLERVWGPADLPGDHLGIMRRPPGTRVIGVVAETVSSVRQIDAPTIYLPLASSTPAAALVATNGDPRDIARAVQRDVRSVNPDATAEATFVANLLRHELELPADLAALAGGVGFTALALALMGLFAMTSFVVAQRSHEVSVRMALGATRRAVVRMIVRESLRPVVLGLLCGLALAWFATAIFGSVLYGVGAHDPIAMIGAAGVMLGTAALASWIPARAAAIVDPSEALKGK
jgi:predicted permease